MKIFTKSPVRNIWRLMLIIWLVYVTINLISGIIGIFPIQPTDKFFGIDLGEPNLFAGSVTAFIAVAMSSIILVFPALFLWAFVEDKCWPQPSTPIIFEKKQIE